MLRLGSRWAQLGEHWARLDEFEGDACERLRTEVALPDGRTVAAHIYALRARLWSR